MAAADRSPPTLRGGRVRGFLARNVVHPVAGSAAFARVGPHVFPHVDRALHKVTGGRVVSSRVFVDSLVLTATGRRSGEPREVPLACTQEPAGTWLVVGSNFGKEHHPAWTANLLAHPRAIVSYEGESVPVTAHLLEGAERVAAWDRLVQVWPVYDRYEDRADRSLRVFRLTPV